MVNVSASSPVDDKKARLKHLIQRLPNLPGVYKMLGKNGDILYVGKAKSLKSRVNSYFAKTIDHPKTRALVARIHNIETIITRSETEALLLEQTTQQQRRLLRLLRTQLKRLTERSAYGQQLRLISRAVFLRAATPLTLLLNFRQTSHLALLLDQRQIQKQ